MINRLMPNLAARGHKLLAYASQSDSSAVVLVDKQDQDVTRFVTWRMNREGDTFLGHYHKSIEEARVDFLDRVNWGVSHARA